MSGRVESGDAAASISPESLTPKRVVTELDRYIVGQGEAKRAVAIAIRNRWRRQQLSEEMRQEVAPKNTRLGAMSRRLASCHRRR